MKKIVICFKLVFKSTICFMLSFFLLYNSFTLVYAYESTSDASVTTDETNVEAYELIAESIQTVFSEENGLKNNEANTLAQSSDGYLWIGSYSGLFRFNGKVFEQVDHKIDPDFTSTSVRYLFEAQNGAMYVASNEKGVFSYKSGDFSALVQEDTQNLSLSARHIVENSLGELYVVTTGGIGKIVDGKVVPAFDDSIDDTNVLSIAFDSNNSMWMIDIDHNLSVYKDGQMKDVSVVNSTDEHFLINTIFSFDGNTMYIGTTAGDIIFLSPSDETYSVIRTNGIGNVYSFNKDNDGKIWVSGENGVGYIKNDSQVLKIEGLAIDSFIRGMYQDHEGSYWFASSRGGVIQLKKSKFYNELLAAGETSSYVNANHEWKDIKYVALDNGLLALKDNRIIENFVTKELEGIRIRCLMVDSKDNFWISTYSDKGLIKIDADHNIFYFNTSNGLTSNKVRFTIEKSDGTIWVGTDNGVNVISENSVIKTFTDVDGISNTTVLSIIETVGSRMLIGSDGGGIYIVDDLNDSDITSISTNEGLSAGIILRMIQNDTTGDVYVATGGNKLDVLSKDDIETIEAFSTDGNIFDLKMDGDNLIIFSSRGVYVLDSKTLFDDEPNFQVYGVAEGLNSGITPNSWNQLKEDGTVYISCNESVFSIDLNDIHKITEPSQVNISEIDLDGIKYYSAEAITIPAETNRITFSFSILSYADNANSTLYYQLKGFDKEPTKVFSKDTQSISYTNLASGNYTFEVWGYNADGVKSSNIASVEIYQDSTWYELPFVVISGVILLIFIIVFTVSTYHTKRTQVLKKRQQEYKDITIQAVKAISRTIDAKDTYTNGHSERVASYTLAIAKTLGYNDLQTDVAYYTALLHDIGKIGIPDAILNKPGKLTAEEYEIMKKHPVIGAEILKDVTIDDSILLGAKYHHERFDGSGYMFGLKGEEIPMIARIICVADAFDAMITRRCYKDTMDTSSVIQELRDCKNTQFDPDIVEAFIDLIEDGLLDDIILQNSTTF